MKTAALMIGQNRCLSVRIARRPMEKMRGLSGQTEWDRTPLVFLFRRRCRPAFWMHRVSEPLDIVWVSQGEIIGITDRIPPAKSRSLLYNLFFLPRYSPPEKIDMAIEFPGGEAKRFGISNGQSVFLEF